MDRSDCIRACGTLTDVLCLSGKQCFYMSMPTLSILSLSECSSVTDDGMILLAKNSPNLRSLNINRCQLLTGRSLRALAQVIKIIYFRAQVAKGYYNKLLSPRDGFAVRGTLRDGHGLW